MLLDIIPFAHDVLKQYIQQGDVVVDATAGNGYDTVFLAQCVGQSGKVYAFDVQEQALQETYKRLQQNGLLEIVQLICASHDSMASYVENAVTAVIFNFGYLPRSNKKIVTLPESSLKAVDMALGLLKSGGVLVAVIYPGHEIGKQEKLVLLDYFSRLARKQYRVVQYGLLNCINEPPFVVAVEKLN